MDETQNYINARQVTTTGYAMIGITSFFCVARFGLRFWKSVPFQAEDVFILLSWGVFLTVAILYIVVTPVLYRVDDVMSGKSPPYAAIEQDALFIIKIFFANTLLYWLTLWAVKLSLLFLYQRLFKGLQNQMRWWWAVLIFTIVVSVNWAKFVTQSRKKKLLTSL